MFAQVFPLFQDNSVFSTITSVYADGFMNPAVRPTAANPTAQGVVSIVALVVNVVILASIIKRAKAQEEEPLQAGDLHRPERLPGGHGESLKMNPAVGTLFQPKIYTRKARLAPCFS